MALGFGALGVPGVLTCARVALSHDEDLHPALHFPGCSVCTSASLGSASGSLGPEQMAVVVFDVSPGTAEGFAPRSHLSAVVSSWSRPWAASGLLTQNRSLLRTVPHLVA